MLNSSIGRLRVTGIVEGISFLLLLGVAMPLKYLAGMPQMVSVVGMAHGILWLLYLAAVVDVRLRRRWPLSRVVVALVASVLPFGPFLLEPSLRREHEAERAGLPVDHGSIAQQRPHQLDDAVQEHRRHAQADR